MSISNNQLRKSLIKPDGQSTSPVKSTSTPRVSRNKKKVKTLAVRKEEDEYPEDFEKEEINLEVVELDLQRVIADIDRDDDMISTDEKR